MYTSDTDNRLKRGMGYLAASIAIAVAAAIYGLFSHGVQSYYMTYAFMIPLIAGAMPCLMAALKSEVPQGDAEPSFAARILQAKDTQLAIIATLTAGSLLKGALEIYGTTNRLLLVYPAMAALILVVSIAAFVKEKRKK